MPGVHDPRTDALLDPATYADDVRMHAVLGELRADVPVAWNDTAGFWAVTRHADVVTASSDPATFCSSRGILVEEIGRTYDSPPTMMHTDPPAHTRYRKLVLPGFRPSVVRQLEADVRRQAAELLDALPSGTPVDLVAELAVPLPLRVIAAVLGLPDGHEERLWRWSEAVIPGATDWSEEERMTLLGDMTVELLGLAVARRAEPAADVVSMLAAVEADGERLTDDELGMFLVQLLVAGNETTRHAVSGGVAALARHPDQWAMLRDDRSFVTTAVEEILRWTTPVTSFLRTATTAVELGGVAIAAGDPLLLVYASANRDAAAFGPAAGEFDVARSPNHHVAFGFGPHFCLGAALARLELAVVLEGLLERFTAIAPAGPVERTGSSVIAGIRRAEFVLRK
ncbi:MAG: cytochrome P450 [Acidimicrobiales bacterium]